MAADLTADNLLSPDGRLIPKVHFPGQSLTSVKRKLAKFIANAKTDATAANIPEDTLRAFQAAKAYYRAFDEVYQRLIVVAASVTVDEGNRSYLRDQIVAVQAERDAALAEATDLIPSAATVAPLPSGETQSIGIRFTGPCLSDRRYPTTEAEARRWSGR